MSDILFETHHCIAVITLNRPSALNALTFPMIQSLQYHLEKFEQDDTIQAIVIRAVAGKAFCAGGDVRAMYDIGKRSLKEALTFFDAEYRLNALIHQLKKPYLALLDGITMGGGVGISLHGSFPIATERFLFAMPETTIGFFPDVGASYALSRLAGCFGIYLGLTGNRLFVNEATTIGLIPYHIASADIASLFEDVLACDFKLPPHEAVKGLLAPYLIKNEPDSTCIEHMEWIKQCFCFNEVERIMKALKEHPSQWSQDIYQQLLQKSPLSLKVTLAQLQKASQLSFASCLQLDAQLVRHFLVDNDFYEGVRALLIDKDKSPKWSPPTLADVSEEKVKSYFT